MQSRTAWTAADFSGPEDWCLRLDEAALAGLASGLPSFQPMAAEIRNILRYGRGFVVIRGLPLDRMNEQQCRELYLALGKQIGKTVPQTVSGELLYSVRNEGIRIDADYGKPGVRVSKTDAYFDFHTDSPSRLAGFTPDFVALLILRTAASGGESVLLNAATVYQIIERERPDVLERLSRPFWVDRRAELPPGEDPVLPVPVFTRAPELQIRYLRLYITKGHEFKQEPLTDAEIEALDFFESVMRRPGLAVTVPAERGDVQIISNTRLLHSRKAYVDHDDPALRRHYLRMWLVDPAK